MVQLNVNRIFQLIRNKLISLHKAGILPPHPRSLVTAARNREALAMGALTLDALDEAEKDEEAEDTE